MTLFYYNDVPFFIYLFIGVITLKKINERSIGPSRQLETTQKSSSTIVFFWGVNIDV